jgi:hypothetical protein
MGAIHLRAVQGGVAVAGNAGAGTEGGPFGRSTELDQIRSVVRRVAGGAGQAVLVTGEAGIGKTRVVAAGLGDAVGLGVRVFQGAAEELERRRPFGVIADCLAVAGRPP